MALAAPILAIVALIALLAIGVRVVVRRFGARGAALRSA
jgi:hypothetical protein